MATLLLSVAAAAADAALVELWI